MSKYSSASSKYPVHKVYIEDLLMNYYFHFSRILKYRFSACDRRNTFFNVLKFTPETDRSNIRVGRLCCLTSL